MPCLLGGHNELRDPVDKKNVNGVDRSHCRDNSFVALCALQLKLAIDESRLEMDSLAAEIIGTSNCPSTELITRLQSVDRLMQRLTNVHTNLERFTQYQQKGRPAESSTWGDFLEQARDTFTMEQERELFDSMLNESEE